MEQLLSGNRKSPPAQFRQKPHPGRRLCGPASQSRRHSECAPKERFRQRIQWPLRRLQKSVRNVRTAASSRWNTRRRRVPSVANAAVLFLRLRRSLASSCGPPKKHQPKKPLPRYLAGSRIFGSGKPVLSSSVSNANENSRSLAPPVRQSAPHAAHILICAITKSSVDSVEAFALAATCIFRAKATWPAAVWFADPL